MIFSGIGVGLLWGVVNLALIRSALRSFLIEKNRLRTVMYLAIKFPVLYTAGFFLLKADIFPLLSLLSGFGLSLAVSLVGGYVLAKD